MRPNCCYPTQIGYARVVAKCYLRRLETAMPGESPLVRQWILLRMLCARRYGATVAEISEEMGVSDTTVRRDRETFQKAGFPLEETVGDHGVKRWRVDPAKTQPGLTFTFDEAIALYLGRHLMEPLKRYTIYNWIERKNIPAHKVGGLWKFRKEEIDEWVRSGRAGHSNEKRKPC